MENYGHYFLHMVDSLLIEIWVVKAELCNLSKIHDFRFQLGIVIGKPHIKFFGHKTFRWKRENFAF